MRPLHVTLAWGATVSHQWTTCAWGMARSRVVVASPVPLTAYGAAPTSQWGRCHNPQHPHLLAHFPEHPQQSRYPEKASAMNSSPRALSPLSLGAGASAKPARPLRPTLAGGFACGGGVLDGDGVSSRRGAPCAPSPGGQGARQPQCVLSLGSGLGFGLDCTLGHANPNNSSWHIRSKR